MFPVLIHFLWKFKTISLTPSITKSIVVFKFFWPSGYWRVGGPFDPSQYVCGISLKHYFLKNSYKCLVRHIYICLCLHIHRHALGYLAVYFLGENLNKFDKLYIFPYTCFLLKDYRKSHVGTRYKRNLISLFCSIH